MKKFALALMASAAMVLGLGLVANAEYPPQGGFVTARPTTVAPNAQFEASASCQPGENVTFLFEGQSKTATCGAAGSAGTASLIRLSNAGGATVQLTAPATEGSYTGTATGSATGALGSFTITVVVATVPPGPLPATGSDGTGTMTFMALGLFAVGAGLFGVSRFRLRTVAA